jgi:hypothetical protein
MKTKKMSEMLLRFAVVVLVLSVLLSFGLSADEETIKMVNQGEKFYKAVCLLAREFFPNTVGGEFDRLGNLKPECDPKKVIPRDIAKAVKWGAEKVEKAIEKYGEKRLKEDTENPWKNKD